MKATCNGCLIMKEAGIWIFSEELLQSVLDTATRNEITNDRHNVDTLNH